MFLFQHNGQVYTRKSTGAVAAQRRADRRDCTGGRGREASEPLWARHDANYGDTDRIGGSNSMPTPTRSDWPEWPRRRRQRPGTDGGRKARSGATPTGRSEKKRKIKRESTTVGRGAQAPPEERQAHRAADGRRQDALPTTASERPTERRRGAANREAVRLKQWEARTSQGQRGAYPGAIPWLRRTTTGPEGRGASKALVERSAPAQERSASGGRHKACRLDEASGHHDTASECRVGATVVRGHR